MELIQKSNPTKEEYVIARILSVFGMRKLAKDKVAKIMENAETK